MRQPQAKVSLVALSRLAALVVAAACGARTGFDFAGPPATVPGASDGSASSDAGDTAGASDASDIDAPEPNEALAPSDDRSDDGPPTSCNPGFATSQSGDPFGQIVDFDNGAALPAGHYRVQYVDGCMKYSAAQDWAVQAYADGSDAFWLVGATSADRIMILPGTVGFMVGSGGFATFDECVAANLALPPVRFDFAGGPLGVWLSDSPYSDNIAGADGRNPKWSLTFLGDCPSTH
jgi:hypothetical protein